MNAEATLAMLTEFEFEKERLLKMKEEASSGASNATNFRRLCFRKKVRCVFHPACVLSSKIIVELLTNQVGTIMLRKFNSPNCVNISTV